MNKPPAEEEQEQIWWVDDNDMPLGSVNRKKAHDEYLMHREVALLIYDENNRVLFQKRSMKKRSNPGMWSTSVAGHIRYGHDHVEEMKKEAEEELGLAECDLVYKGKEIEDDGVEHYFKYWFEAQVEQDHRFDLNAEEVVEVRFLTPSELDRLISSGTLVNPVFVNYVRKFWERKK